MYFIGDVIMNEDADAEEALCSTFLETSVNGENQRVLFVAIEDKDYMDTMAEEFNRGAPTDIFLDFVDNLMRGYNRRCDIFLLDGKKCYYHVLGHATLMIVRKSKHVVLKQDNWFLSDNYPFWTETSIKADDLMLYGDDIEKEGYTIEHAYCLYIYNRLLKKGGCGYMSYHEMLEDLEYKKGCFTSMVGVYRR